MGNVRPFGEVKGEQLLVYVDDKRVAKIDWDKALGVEPPLLDPDEDGSRGQLKTIDVTIPMSAGEHKIGVTFLATNFAPGLDMNHAVRAQHDRNRRPARLHVLPAHRQRAHRRTERCEGSHGFAEPQAHLHVPPGQAERRRALRARDHDEARLPRVSRLLDAGERRCADGLLQDRTQQRRLVRRRCRGDRAASAGRAEVPVSRGVDAERRGTGGAVSRRRSGSGRAPRRSSSGAASRTTRCCSSRNQKQLSKPAVLQKQVRRMLGDPRASALTRNFAAQWLGLRALAGHAPVVDQFPDFDDNLRQSFREETELLFTSLLDEDRSVLDLLTADYTFVNERLAKHYGIPGVRGSEFRRVKLEGDLASAAGPARQRRDPHGVVAAGSHVAGDSWPVGVAQPPRYAGAGSASQRAGARGEDHRPGRQRQGADDARSALRSPRQAAVRGLPQDDGPHRLRARAVRCRRSCAHGRPAAASRSTRRT